MNKKKVISMILAMQLVFCIPVSGEPNIDQINKKIKEFELRIQENRNNSQKIKELMDELQKEINEVDIIIEKYDHKRSVLDGEIEKNNKEIEKIDSRIQELQNKEKGLKEELEIKRELFKRQVKFLYSNGLLGKIEMIFSAESFEAFMGNLNFMNKLTKKNKELYDEIQRDLKEVDQVRAELKEERVAIEEINEGIIAKRDEINKLRADQQVIIDKLDEQKAEYKKEIAKYNLQIEYAEYEITKSNNQIEKIKALAASKKESRESKGEKSGVSGEEIIAAACEFLGQPYYYGGTRPYDGSYGSGFDCSGLVQYVYAKYGIVTGRTTYNQIDHPNGTNVKRSELQPGDLIFFGSWDDPHHVGLYVGDNKYIHAPRTGDVIKISPLTRRDYVVARRFIK